MLFVEERRLLHVRISVLVLHHSNCSDEEDKLFEGSSKSRKRR